MKRAYFRRFVREWCGGVDEHCTFVVVDGSRVPRKTGDNEITVGAGWLKRQCVPREALEGAK